MSTSTTSVPGIQASGGTASTTTGTCPERASSDGLHGGAGGLDGTIQVDLSGFAAKFSKEWFLARSKIDPNTNCWNWQLCKDKAGYGCMGHPLSHNCGAHRASYYELVSKVLPKGLVVRHKCNNPSCINPDHLVLGTYAENRADCKAINGLNTAQGERVSTAKLTAEQVYKIRASQNISNTQLAKLYKVHLSTISLIRSNKLWKHLL